MAKRGPKPKITEAVKLQIYAILTTGGSLDDAAGYLEIDTSTIHRAKKSDTKFATGVKKAVRTGKLKLIQKVGKSASWQAAAWMLERKFGAEYGRKDKHEVTGKNGGPIESTTKIVAERDKTAAEFEDFTRRRMGAQVLPPNGN
jgi:hypothetical protein